MPPMHGDFEAQRHWMEITIHLPISQWYFYDLEWWGLDYPPLTAYHSWVLGEIGSIFNPTWFALFSSRRLDEPLLKVYMRATVLLSEYSTYVPAVVIFLRRYSRVEGLPTWEASIALVAVLMQPVTILTDHAHFQYNTVMLGLVTASTSSFIAGRQLWGCVFYVAALGYKQMALYYAPTIFAYLLGTCFFPRLDVRGLLKIALITALSFSVLFAPLIIGSLYDSRRGISPESTEIATELLRKLDFLLPLPIQENAWFYPPLLQLTQSVHRIFPFARGVFEDKVANLWCALHVIHKLNRYPSAVVQRLALVATVISILPPCLVIFFRPRKELLPLALSSTAWGFFLCSFQVHEKSVLLPLLPMTLLLASRDGLTPSIRGWVIWANVLGCWTMFPLLKRDKLRVPYFMLTLLYPYLLGLQPSTGNIYASDPAAEGNLRPTTRALHLLFYAAMAAWHAAEAFIPTPQGKPDLWVVVNVGIGAFGFVICYLWCLWRLVSRSGILSSWGFTTGRNGSKQLKLQ
ncbi:MAG: Glucosyltransferase-like protein [Candelina submexicana]|nr:MAG: Glucosyltransferase-like protein [Candelina submexicana]